MSRARQGATTSVREAIHAVFLYHAIKAGLTMGIVNAGPTRCLRRDSRRPARGRRGCVLNRRPDSPNGFLPGGEVSRQDDAESDEKDREWRGWRVEKRLEYALVKGIAEFVEDGHRGGAPAGRTSARVIEGRFGRK